MTTPLEALGSALDLKDAETERTLSARHGVLHFDRQSHASARPVPSSTGARRVFT